MGIFKKLTTDNLEETEDKLGGSFDAVPSDAYLAVIKNAYAGETQAGATNVTLIADLNGTEYRETIYITNREGNNYYLSKDDKKTKIPLPGFTTINDICLLTTGEELSDQETENKMVKVYNFDEKKELPTEVPVITSLLGKEVKLGILREVSNKQKRGDDGEYHDVYDDNGKPVLRTTNTINKVFHAETGRTVNEYRHEVEEPEFLKAWTERNQGKDRDRTNKGAAGSGASGSGKPGGEKSAKKKLFG